MDCTCDPCRSLRQQIANSFSLPPRSRFISLFRFASSFRLLSQKHAISSSSSLSGYSRMYIRCTRCASTCPVWRLPNDVERIGKVDRLKSIMLGDYREELALVTVQLDLWLWNVLVIRGFFADSKSLKEPLEYVLGKMVEYLVEGLRDTALKCSYYDLKNLVISATVRFFMSK